MSFCNFAAARLEFVKSCRDEAFIQPGWETLGLVRRLRAATPPAVDSLQGSGGETSLRAHCPLFGERTTLVVRLSDTLSYDLQG